MDTVQTVLVFVLVSMAVVVGVVGIQIALLLRDLRKMVKEGKTTISDIISKLRSK